MKHLYVPFRSKYVKENRTINNEQCVFCEQIESNDDKKHFILGRYKYNVVMLNLYPYNAGHLMIIPYKHCSDLDDLDKEERNELMELISESIKILQNQMNPSGVNIGMNIGKDAGAGIPDHLHMHILPRWKGDTNFLPTLFETKTISFDLNKIYDELRPKFENLKI